MKQLLFLSFLFAFLFSCKNEKKPAFEVKARDTSITIVNSYTNLFLDSTAMESFISREAVADSFARRVRSFYNSRNYQYAWFDSMGIAEHAYSFLNMQSQYIDYAQDSSLFNPFLNRLLDSLITDSSNYTINEEQRLKAELELTAGFFRYADKAYQGTPLSTRDLEWFIPRKKIDVVGLLDSLVAGNGKDLANYEPVNKQYNLLKKYLLGYYRLEKEGGWDSIATDKKYYKPGDSSIVLRHIKKRLLRTGDLTGKDTTAVYDQALTVAVKNFQHRHGLKEDGVMGTSFFAELNRPVSERIRQLLINMERVRWVPADPPPDYLLVNIPAYKLFVYEKDKLAWDMNVVVGSVAHNTVIFRGDMKYVVFSPYWNVPPGILRNEVLPGIRRSSNYLARHNMEWHNGTVRQKPGPNNSLGLVKFLFPNSYNIYLHDTPAKSLFNETKRAFSHGCIRLADARKLAEYILRNDSAWTKERITKAMHSRKEQFVRLSQTIPVFIGYFTVWVDRDGKLNFRDDVYGHDRKMSELLF
ncbi:MAG TPA: L,D-transpeptidase family protein [Chitinophagaceae bacterium]|nr:L,D-transpeptidase family protein [Chitinophagaceae bacterium]